jgi:hypothetical protein
VSYNAFAVIKRKFSGIVNAVNALTLKFSNIDSICGRGSFTGAQGEAVLGPIGVNAEYQRQQPTLGRLIKVNVGQLRRRRCTVLGNIVYWHF